MDGDPEANFAHFCLQKFGWEPSKFMNLPVKERAFVIASIKTRIEAEKKKEAELRDFIQVLLESAKVFQTRRQQKVERYQELLKKKHQGKLGVDEEEFLELYKVLSSYGMVEKLPKNMLDSKFEEQLQRILELGNAIIAEHKME